MLKEETLVVHCWSLLKLHYFSSSWPLEMSTTPRCPLLEIAAVCSYITGNSCQRQSQCLALWVRVWTPVQVVLFVLRTCLVLVEASWSQWTGGSLGFTERCRISGRQTVIRLAGLSIHAVVQLKLHRYSNHFPHWTGSFWYVTGKFFIPPAVTQYRRFESKSRFLY